MTGDDAGPRCEVRRLCAADGHREARLPDVTARTRPLRRRQSFARA